MHKLLLDLQDKEAIKKDKQGEEKGKREGDGQVEHVINEKNDEQIHEINAEIELGPKHEVEPEPAAEAKTELRTREVYKSHKSLIDREKKIEN